jgi:hypothetical protein
MCKKNTCSRSDKFIAVNLLRLRYGNSYKDPNDLEGALFF